MKRLLLLFSLTAAVPAYGSSPSPLAVGPGQHAMLGLDLLRSSGQLPAFSGEGSFERTSYWIHLRAGTASDSPGTLLGTQLGVETDLALGFTPAESKTLHDAFPIGFSGRVGLVLRALTFNVPLQGVLMPHLSVELGAGGAHWWSDTARLSFIGGARLAVAGRGEANLELDYAVVPFVLTGSPGDLVVRHLEHRISVTAGASFVGLGLWLRFTRDEWRVSDGVPYMATTGRAIGASLEWRPR